MPLSHVLVKTKIAATLTVLVDESGSGMYLASISTEAYSPIISRWFRQGFRGIVRALR